MTLFFSILSFSSPLSFSILSFSLSINIFSSSNRVISLSLNSPKRNFSTLIRRLFLSYSCDSSINFNFLVKYSPTYFPVALFFQLAFLAFLPIGLSKLEVSPSLDLQSLSPIDVDSGVGGTDALDLPLVSAHFGWSFNMSQQCSRRKGFLKVSLYKALALAI